MKRWYDAHKKLAPLLESLKTLKQSTRDRICTSLINCIKEYDASLIDEQVLEFPLELPQRRWYDKDPYLWLVFNGLSRADPAVIKKATALLQNMQ